jgi:hypothetical protein
VGGRGTRHRSGGGDRRVPPRPGPFGGGLAARPRRRAPTAARVRPRGRPEPGRLRRRPHRARDRARRLALVAASYTLAAGSRRHRTGTRGGADRDAQAPGTPAAAARAGCRRRLLPVRARHQCHRLVRRAVPARGGMAQPGRAHLDPSRPTGDGRPDQPVPGLSLAHRHGGRPAAGSAAGPCPAPDTVAGPTGHSGQTGPRPRSDPQHLDAERPERREVVVTGIRVGHQRVHRLRRADPGEGVPAELGRVGDDHHPPGA